MANGWVLMSVEPALHGVGGGKGLLAAGGGLRTLSIHIGSSHMANWWALGGVEPCMA